MEEVPLEGKALEGKAIIRLAKNEKSLVSNLEDIKITILQFIDYISFQRTA